jgi:hypothetical protein
MLHLDTLLKSFAAVSLCLLFQSSSILFLLFISSDYANEVMPFFMITQAVDQSFNSPFEGDDIPSFPLSRKGRVFLLDYSLSRRGCFHLILSPHVRVCLS